MSNYSRSRTRKFLYQLLFATTFNSVDVEGFKESFYSGVFESNIDEEYLSKMYEIILNNESFLIEILKRFAPKFDIKNMEYSYVLPIYIGISEILYYPEEIPVKVSINEAVEIAKVYGDDSSRKFVNGVLYTFSNEVDSLIEESKDFSLDNSLKHILKK
ncbi:MAG: transcription antitermination protein NusB [Candidatus Gracilibacteria bacterium]|nr:transcription antitermination protein NusB [Candidatus Gracilibacteria bacterium]